jgi:hypothetical protein
VNVTRTVFPAAGIPQVSRGTGRCEERPQDEVRVGEHDVREDLKCSLSRSGLAVRQCQVCEGSSRNSMADLRASQPW